MTPISLSEYEQQEDRYYYGPEEGPQTRRDKIMTWAINRVGLWITLDWWRFVLDDSRCDKEYGPFVVYYHELPRFIPDRIAERYDFEFYNPLRVFANWLSRCHCRASGHSAGVFFYNPGAYEPDMHCRGCGEDLG